MTGETKPDVQFWMAQAQFEDGRTGVVEVIHEPDTDRLHTVLLSELVEGQLQCQIGFVADPVRCDEMNAKGFTCIEALISLEGDILRVRAAAFVPGRREIEYEHEWLVVSGVEFGAGGKRELKRDYLQVQATPDLVLPAENVRIVPVVWPVVRQQVIRPKAPARITVTDRRWPLMLGLKDVPATAWTGTIARPDGADIWGNPAKREARREKRPVEFRSARSSFRAVEVLGFRLEVPRFAAGRKLKTDEERQGQQEEQFYRLISPLNFHLPKQATKDEADLQKGKGNLQQGRADLQKGEVDDRVRPDFHYRPATSGLTIELLRYGRMSVAEPIGGMELEDFQSQHELLARVVVGRVDEDASQAQEVATFVPAIFVDNTWSKHLGRYYMGLGKRLAYFCTREGEEVVPLSPRDAYDGRDPPPPALARIAEIHLAKRLLRELPSGPEAVEGGDGEKQKKDFEKLSKEIEAERGRLAKGAPLLLTIECDRDLIDGWDDFRDVPTDAVLRNSPLAARRWRQEDFDDAAVRRDFARAAGQGSAGSFLGTQCSPLVVPDDAQECRETQAWVSGRYSMTGSAMMARPRGVIRVTLCRLPGDPVDGGWERLCNLLEVPTRGDRFKTFTLGPGSWYRLQYDMDLSMQNGPE